VEWIDTRLDRLEPRQLIGFKHYHNVDPILPRSALRRRN
jgi:hypothetical protein